MADDPYALFERWFADARASEPNDPDAMALATVDAAGVPSVRMVLLKKVDVDKGFTFHTNSLSRKGQAMADNPNVALLFHWKSLRRQIRIEGVVSDAGETESDAYFATRGRESQLSAWASRQSQPMASRDQLIERQAMMADRFPADVPRPPHWHGYRVAPKRIEFWSDGAHRLHDRHIYIRRVDGSWDTGLLFP